MLLGVKGSLSAIARAVGAKSMQSPLDWRNGVKVPTSAMRAQLYAVYKIAPESWGQMPHTTGHAEPPVAIVAANGSTPSNLEDCMSMLIAIRRQRDRPGLLAAESTKLVDTEVKVMALRARLEREKELLEDRIVREHPEWLRLRRVLVRILSAHPAAAKAVLEELGSGRA